MILAAVFLPLMLAVFTLIFRSIWIGRIGLCLTAITHVACTVLAWQYGSQYLKVPLLGRWVALDEIGRFFLTILSILVIPTFSYALGYLVRQKYVQTEMPEAERFRREYIFSACLMFFTASMTLVMYCQHFELLWVAIAATTLSSTPLIYFHHNQHSIEATWKYLLLCSFGIALSLLGNFLLAIATGKTQAAHEPLLLSSLIANAKFLEPTWLKVSFIFLLVGYGTKTGLAPMHTWLPDAHSEAPSAVSALLSGASLNCAFLAILRAYQVCVAAGLASTVQQMLIVFGMVSIAIGGVFILKQKDFKRMLAYSSVENMGILTLALGLGGVAIFGGFLHALGHSVVKAMLFLLAGNILMAYQSKSTQSVQGALRVMPMSAALWFLGFLTITSFPPFGLFWSKFVILSAAVEQHRLFLVALILFSIALVFIGMTSATMKILLGEAVEVRKKHIGREWRWSSLPPLLLFIFLLLLGPHMPQFLWTSIGSVTRVLGGKVPEVVRVTQVAKAEGVSGAGNKWGWR